MKGTLLRRVSCWPGRRAVIFAHRCERAAEAAWGLLGQTPSWN